MSGGATLASARRCARSASLARRRGPWRGRPPGRARRSRPLATVTDRRRGASPTSRLRPCSPRVTSRRRLPRSRVASQRRSAGLPQVACFDTAFHHDLPLVARTLPIPAGSGVRRYGFHGLSYEWAVSVLGDALGERAVIAHLGSGASLAAVRNGQCVDTTMGLTPIGGLMMSTRSGDVDPGALVHLIASAASTPTGSSGSSRTRADCAASRARLATCVRSSTFDRRMPGQRSRWSCGA